MAIVKPIHSDVEHAAALKRLEDLWDSREGTPEFEELELLGMVVDAYERVRHPIDDPTPLEQVQYLLDQKRLSPEGTLISLLNHRQITPDQVQELVLRWQAA